MVSECPQGHQMEWRQHGRSSHLLLLTSHLKHTSCSINHCIFTSSRLALILSHTNKSIKSKNLVSEMYIKYIFYLVYKAIMELPNFQVLPKPPLQTYIFLSQYIKTSTWLLCLYQQNKDLYTCEACWEWYRAAIILHISIHCQTLQSLVSLYQHACVLMHTVVSQVRVHNDTEWY